MCSSLASRASLTALFDDYCAINNVKFAVKFDVTSQHTINNVKFDVTSQHTNNNVKFALTSQHTINDVKFAVKFAVTSQHMANHVDADSIN